mgnify:CR=1 FL=1
MKIEVKNLKELGELAVDIGQRMKPGDVFLLRGDLGAGKTSLVSKIASYLGEPEAASSPSFSIVNIYDTDPRINHLDLYRLESEDEVLSFEYELYFFPEDSISFIEWPDRARSFLPRRPINIDIEVDDGKRIITIDDKFFERND